MRRITLAVVGICMGLWMGCDEAPPEEGTGGSGGSLGGASCEGVVEEFTPCGGDLLGTWVLETICPVTEEVEGQNCENEQVEMNLSFDDGMSYTFDGSKVSTPATRSSFEIKTRFPASCLEDDRTCEEASVPLLLSCSGDDECLCIMAFEGDEEAKTYDYTVDGDVLTMHGEEDEPDEFQYCVQGDRLYMFKLATNPLEPSPGVLVARRQ